MTSAFLPLLPRPSAARGLDRRFAGAAAALLFHAALVGIYLVARPSIPDAQPDGPRLDIQWIALPAPRPAPPVVPAPAPAPAVPAPRQRPAAARPAPPAMDLVQAPVAAIPAPALSMETPPAPVAETILEKARRSAGGVDRALRKENRPYIVAPLDSPQIRMRAGMEQAYAMAPPQLWEAPKVEELVNQTGDGARRTRVISGKKTYCISERSPATNVEMIEMHGKLRLTNCPQHESTASQQAWRNARD